MKKSLPIITIAFICSGCGITEDEQQTVACPSWTFTTPTANIIGNIGQANTIPNLLMGFEQDPVEDDEQAGILTGDAVTFGQGIFSGNIALQIQQTPVVWSSATQLDDMPPPYTPPTLTVTNKTGQFVEGHIKGQATKTDTQKMVTEVEDFELTFKLMAPGVDVPSECYGRSGQNKRMCQNPAKKTNAQTMQIECTYVCTSKEKQGTKCFDAPRESCPTQWTFYENQTRVDCKS